MRFAIAVWTGHAAPRDNILLSSGCSSYQKIPIYLNACDLIKKIIKHTHAAGQIGVSEQDKVRGECKVQI